MPQLLGNLLQAVTAKIIQMPRRVCFDCLHGYSGAGGVYCRMFDETIRDETVARTCPEYKDSFMKQDTLAAARRAHPSSQALQRDVIDWSPSHEQAVDYIRSLHTTLWGVQLMVIKPADLDRAADWILKLYADLSEHFNG
jgi:hypothetical protein